MYFATILRAQNLKVAALLDSDAEGDLAAKQDTLVNALGNKRILRTKDVYQSGVFDTQEYGREYGKSPINKDFRGASTSQKSLFW